MPTCRRRILYIPSLDTQEWATISYLQGNPEGDFNTGGKDPGIRSTRWIFNLTYSMGRESYYRGKTVAMYLHNL